MVQVELDVRARVEDGDWLDLTKDGRFVRKPTDETLAAVANALRHLAAEVEEAARG